MNLRSRWALAVVCFLLGIGLVAQLRARRHQYASSKAAGEDQSAILGSLVVANAELRNEVQKLEGEIETYRQASERAALPQMNEELWRMQIINGRGETTGPGVEVRVGAGVSAVDLQDLLNEVRNVGAEAISLNGTRLTIRSSVWSDGDAITLDGKRLEAPFVFLAIGDPGTMSTALNRHGGVLDILRVGYPGLDLSVKTHSRMVLPPVREPADLVLARPVG